MGICHNGIPFGVPLCNKLANPPASGEFRDIWKMPGILPHGYCGFLAASRRVIHFFRPKQLTRN
jgi:hypothetical protein